MIAGTSALADCQLIHQLRSQNGVPVGACRQALSVYRLSSQMRGTTAGCVHKLTITRLSSFIFLKRNIKHQVDIFGDILVDVPVASVVIPAYNAERWIEQTVTLVRAQTLTNIEIIIVIDGATDGTLRICEELARLDQRILILQVENGGVARARNAGLAIARGEFIAPVDADDLWHPTRLELHVLALRARPDYAMAFSPFVLVDEQGVAGKLSRLYRADGYVFGEHLCANFVGNGSALTMRTEALRAVGGYSASLRDQGGEGCEDHLVQLKLAYLYKVICVASPLVGYRRMAGNMSSNLIRMRVSYILMLDEIERFAARFPGAMFYHPRAKAVLFLAARYIRESQTKEAIALWWKECRRNPLLPVYTPFGMLYKVFKTIAKVWRFISPKRPRNGPQVKFEDWNPSGRFGRPYPLTTRILMQCYHRIDTVLRGRAIQSSRRRGQTNIYGDNT